MYQCAIVCLVTQEIPSLVASNVSVLHKKPSAFNSCTQFQFLALQLSLKKNLDNLVILPRAVLMLYAKSLTVQVLAPVYPTILAIHTLVVDPSVL